MSNSVSPIWQRMPPDLASRTEAGIADAHERLATPAPVHVFFRADDVAVPGSSFARLMALFSRYRVPLCLAVVPVWLTRTRWQSLEDLQSRDASLYCWHQHGWRHANHEGGGKKQEFGPGRPRADIVHDLRCGGQRLQIIMGRHFYPVFTPPWNRCDQDTLDRLKALGYAAVSRSSGSQPPAPEGLPDLYVNVDLHTRKERNPAEGWTHLLEELKQAIISGHCGIMLHHQRMNAAAFDFIELLLKILTQRKGIRLVHFKHLVNQQL